MPGVENPFFLDIYKAVEEGAHGAGYEVVMANTDYSSARLVASVRRCGVAPTTSLRASSGRIRRHEGGACP